MLFSGFSDNLILAWTLGSCGLYTTVNVMTEVVLKLVAGQWPELQKGANLRTEFMEHFGPIFMPFCHNFQIAANYTFLQKK